MMEQVPENNAAPGDSSDATVKPRLGEMLREARERLGLSIADVAGQIKFAPRQIEALEADDFQRLPEMTFVRGFVRSYAKILHLDAQVLLAALPQTEAVATELEPASVEVPFPVAYSVQKQNLILLGVALLLAVLVVAFAVWHFTTPLERSEVVLIETPLPVPAEIPDVPVSQVVGTVTVLPSVPAVMPTPETEQAPVSPTVVPDQAKKPPAMPLRTSTLRLVFDAESWVEVTDGDGNILSSQINPRGSELRLDGRVPLSLVVGQAASVRLYHKGRQVDLAPYINSSSEVARLTLE